MFTTCRNHTKPSTHTQQWYETAAAQQVHKDRSTMASAFRRAAKKTTPSSPDSNASSTANAAQPVQPSDVASMSTTTTSAVSSSLLGLRGVKPWTGGIHLTSVGLNDLDTILGGGQPLGTCILVQEDRISRDLALSLVRYWCAEAVSQEQHLVVPVSREEEPDFISSLSLDDETDEPQGVSRLEMQEFLRALPRNLHWDKEHSKQSQQQKRDEELSQQAKDETLVSKELNVLTEELEDEEEDQDKVEEAEAGLEIAWQYRTSVQQERLAQTTTSSSSSTAKSRNVYCHSYDLSGRMLEQLENFPVSSETSDMDPFMESFHIVTVQEFSGHGRRHNAAPCGMAFFRRLVQLLQDKIRDHKLVRLLLYHPPALGMLTVALPLLLAHIRQLQWPVVVLVCLAPPIGATPEQTYVQTLLYRMVDVVLITEGFTSRREYPPPPEFRHLQGLLTIRKVSTVTAATANGGGHFGDLTVTKRPAAYVYGLKRDRRKLHIPLLHIPPEDYAAGGGSVGSGGVRSGAGRVDTKPSKASSGGGMGCSSNLSGSLLDF